MARTFSRAEQTYPPNTYGPFTINALAAGDQGFKLTLTRVAWPVGAVANVSVEISPDNGANFAPWITVALTGGVILDRFGNPQTTATIQGKWPGENDGTGGRKILRQTDVRFTIQVLQTITTAVTLGPI